MSQKIALIKKKKKKVGRLKEGGLLGSPIPCEALRLEMNALYHCTAGILSFPMSHCMLLVQVSQEVSDSKVSFSSDHHLRFFNPPDSRDCCLETS